MSVYHPTIGADETAIGEKIADRHVAHLGNDWPRAFGTAQRLADIQLQFSLKTRCYR
jgi:hypothetical protein